MAPSRSPFWNRISQRLAGSAREERVLTVSWNTLSDPRYGRRTTNPGSSHPRQIARRMPLFYYGARWRFCVSPGAARSVDSISRDSHQQPSHGRDRICNTFECKLASSTHGPGPTSRCMEWAISTYIKAASSFRCNQVFSGHAHGLPESVCCFRPIFWPGR